MYDKEYAKQWYQKNKERVKTKVHERYEANKDQILAKKKEYRDEHKDKEREYRKQYYQDNKEEVLSRNKQYRLEHLEEEKEWKHNYYLEHKEEHLKRTKMNYQKSKAKKKEKKIEAFNKLAEKYQHAPILNSNGLYQAFENGEIWNWRENELRFMKKDIKNHGSQYDYQMIRLTLEGEQKSYPVNRLIASAFDDRTEEQLKDMECHHCNLRPSNNNLYNLVFLPKQLHDMMHKTLSDDQIKSIGEQVKQLRGTAKTDKFVELTKAEIRKQIDQV